MAENTNTAATETVEVPETVTYSVAARLTREALRENGITDTNVPPQMMYNYTIARIRANKKPFIQTVQVERTVDGKVEMKTELLMTSFTEWLGRYINKKVALSYTK
jgi:hypothetical protein